MDELLVIIPSAFIGVWIGMLVGLACSDPTELPNGCILHDDVIYCEVAE